MLGSPPAYTPPSVAGVVARYDEEIVAAWDALIAAVVGKPSEAQRALLEWHLGEIARLRERERVDLLEAVTATLERADAAQAAEWATLDLALAGQITEEQAALLARHRTAMAQIWERARRAVDVTIRYHGR
jgi:hypothetical protein